MKLNARFWLLPLLTVLVVSYQNCGGQMTSIVSNRWAAGSGGSGNDYLDGLPAGITQTGKAFTRDPATDSGNQSLSLTTDLTNFGAEVSVKHLKNLGYMSNGYIKFESDSMYSTIASPQSSLVYSPTSPRFQQVNAYVHLDTLIADMAGMSMFPSSFTLLDVDAHCSDAVDNAYYSYEDNVLCLGYTDYSSKRLWAADDQDVTVHEFGHALNHKFASSEIITSTPDLGGIDEGFADLWAYRQSLDPKISVWYGRALYNNGSPSLRNLSTVTSYPTDYADEVHDDASFISGAVYQVEKDANLSTEGKTRLEKRLLESLQYGHGMQDAIVALQDEAVDLGISLSAVNAALSARGLYRNDAVSEIQLNTTKPVYVVDNHVFNYQVGGNCNGALDQNESVFLFPNLENTGSIKGGVTVELTSSTAGVNVATGGDVGFVYRLKANSTYASEMASLDKTKTPYLYKLLYPSFAVNVAAGTTGTANFSMKITSMNTISGTPNTKTVSFSLPIGSVATATSCTTTASNGVMP